MSSSSASIDALFATPIVVVAFLRRYAELAWLRVLVARAGRVAIVGLVSLAYLLY